MVRAWTPLFLLLCCACSTLGKSGPTREEKARMLVEVANGAIVERDPIGALTNLQEAEKFAPDLPELHHSRALAYYAKRETAKALESARRSVELKPNYADANNTIGRILLDLNRLEEAEGPLLSASSDPLYRESYKADTNLGILYYRRKDFASARTRLDRAIEAKPARACHAYYYRGHLALRLGRFREATQDYQNAAKGLCAGFVDAHLALGIVYRKSGRQDEARQKFIEIETRYSGTPLADRAIAELRDLP